MAQSARATRDDDMSPRQLGVHCAVCTGIWLFSKLTQCEAGAAVLRERVMMTRGNSADCSEVVERALMMRCSARGVAAAEAHMRTAGMMRGRCTCFKITNCPNFGSNRRMENRRSALRAALAADSLALGVHWNYSVSQLAIHFPLHACPSLR